MLENMVQFLLEKSGELEKENNNNSYREIIFQVECVQPRQENKFTMVT